MNIPSVKSLEDKSIILDIGANDGTLLRYYKKNYTTIGCEPAKNLINSLKKNCKYVMNNFWSYQNFFKLIKKNNLDKPKIITAIGMFYDLEDPNKFIRDAADSLHDKGIFVAQLMCLKSMIEKNDIGNICHEHIEFYSLKSLKFLFENNGLEIFKIEENDINGGSYRIFCRKFNKGSIPLPKENVLTSVKKFVKRANRNKQVTMNFIKKQIKKEKKIFLYGASTKGNTILQYYKLNNKIIPFAAERSPEKWKKYTVGTGIKIISEKEARKLKPDYFFVTPWGFIKEFIKREHSWLKKGGKFLCLEFSQVNSTFLKKIFFFYKKIIPIYGKYFLNNEFAYKYLIESIELFPNQIKLTKKLLVTGFCDIEVYDILDGLASIHLARK